MRPVLACSAGVPSSPRPTAWAKPHLSLVSGIAVGKTPSLLVVLWLRIAEVRHRWWGAKFQWCYRSDPLISGCSGSGKAHRLTDILVLAQFLATPTTGLLSVLGLCHSLDVGKTTLHCVQPMLSIAGKSLLAVISNDRPFVYSADTRSMSAQSDASELSSFTLERRPQLP